MTRAEGHELPESGRTLATGIRQCEKETRRRDSGGAKGQAPADIAAPRGF